MKKRLTIYLILSLGLFLAAGAQHRELIDLRSEYELDSATYLDNAPPLVALTMTALGGFRGLIADGLWLRMSYLQDRGDYFEVVQLADWITKLEPRNTEIWTFHAWNMAYNISVIMAEDQDRWRWVYNGIKLLRDEGMIYNPGDPEIYRQIGWMFQHKIGLPIDLAHQSYKEEWAGQMMDLFGSATPDLNNLDEDTKRSMIEKYKLLPDIMRELQVQYGPWDWRKPQAHSAYWAYRGLKLAEKDSRDFKLCNTMLMQSLRHLSE